MEATIKNCPQTREQPNLSKHAYMTIYNKIKWTLGILLVFFLILATNLIDRNNFRIVKASIETIYADRLIAKDLIHDLSSLLHEKEVRYLKSGRDSFDGENASVNDQSKTLIDAFAETKLIPEEEVIFREFRQGFRDLMDHEQSSEAPPETDDQYFDRLRELDDLLHELSNIQIVEGRRELMESQRALDAVDLFTNLEIYILVFMAVIVQVLVMYRPKLDTED